MQRFTEFVDILREVHSIRPRLALASHMPLGAMVVGQKGETLALVAQRDGRLRERWRYVQSLRNHAPFTEAQDVSEDLGEEYFYEGSSAKGLGLAAASRMIAVSWPDEAWARPRVTLTRLRYEETGSGELRQCQASVEVAQCGRLEHVREHEAFIRSLSLPERFNGEQVWMERRVLFPHSRFLERVEKQLAAMPAGCPALRQVVARLTELDAAVAAWRSHGGAQPQWPPKTTREGETRRRELCRFKDEDGGMYEFDLHLRYTPGAGRIHFRLDKGKGVVAVAHIGKKL